jgi:hypothetical protein
MLHHLPCLRTHYLPTKCRRSVVCMLAKTYGMLCRSAAWVVLVSLSLLPTHPLSKCAAPCDGMRGDVNTACPTLPAQTTDAQGGLLAQAVGGQGQTGPGAGDCSRGGAGGGAARCSPGAAQAGGAPLAALPLAVGPVLQVPVLEWPLLLARTRRRTAAGIRSCAC